MVVQMVRVLVLVTASIMLIHIFFPPMAHPFGPTPIPIARDDFNYDTSQTLAHPFGLNDP